MGHSLKIKISVCLISLSILLSVQVVKSNFFKEPVLKRWSNLTWDDFRGVPVPFTSFGAAISSTIYLEFDSVKNRFFAYAVQDNMRSWTRDTSLYTLRHEQYHFNITEVHARLLNKFIAENPNGSKNLVVAKYNSFIKDLNEMQDRYDYETDHSSLYSRQMYWEFKIDSLLASDSGWTTDYITGAKVYFPSTPKLSKGINSEGYAFKSYQLQKYDIIFTLESFQIPNMRIDIFDQILAMNKKKYNEIVAVSAETQNGLDKLKLVLKDSSGWTTHRYWIRNGDFLYNASAQPPKGLKDSLAYNMMAYSFLNSLCVEDVRPHWIDRDKSSSGKIFLIKTQTLKPNQSPRFEMKRPSTCFNFLSPANYGIFNGPFKTDDGSLLIVFDIIKDSIGDRKYHVLFVGDDMYSFEKDSTEQLYYVPSERLPSGQFEVSFGYAVKADSVQECFRYFRRNIVVENK